MLIGRAAEEFAFTNHKHYLSSDMSSVWNFSLSSFLRTSFRTETSSDLPKCRLLSQALSLAYVWARYLFKLFSTLFKVD